jgi:hypothetical protein
MAARFFVDENDLALGKALDRLQGDVVYPGHLELPDVPRRTPDDVWLQEIGRRGLVVITRDKRIRYRLVEQQAWIANGVRGFVLTGRTSQSTSDSLAVLAAQWTAIEAIVSERGPGPWMFAVTTGRVREIELG